MKCRQSSEKVASLSFARFSLKRRGDQLAENGASVRAVLHVRLRRDRN
jgi:hypothetical protein